MAGGDLIRRARVLAELSQATLAGLAGTSRTTLSAYEHGRKSPTLDTAARILRATGQDLTTTPLVSFRQVSTQGGRPCAVPDVLARLPLELALATVVLPLHLNWSDRGRSFDLRDRRHRARVYEIVLREGRAEDISTYVDGTLLVDLWDELVLPGAVRAAWTPLVIGAPARQAV